MSSSTRREGGAAPVTSNARQGRVHNGLIHRHQQEHQGQASDNQEGTPLTSRYACSIVLLFFSWYNYTEISPYKKIIADNSPFVKGKSHEK